MDRGLVFNNTQEQLQLCDDEAAIVYIIKGRWEPLACQMP